MEGVAGALCNQRADFFFLLWRRLDFDDHNGVGGEGGRATVEINALGIVDEIQL